MCSKGQWVDSVQTSSCGVWSGQHEPEKRKSQSLKEVLALHKLPGADHQKKVISTSSARNARARGALRQRGLGGKKAGDGTPAMEENTSIAI